MTQPSTSDRDSGLDAQRPAVPAKPEKSSLLDDFMDIFYAPSAVFARRATRDFWIPLIIVTLIMGVVFIANRDLYDPIMEAEFSRSMAQSAQGRQMSPEQVAAATKFASKFAIVGAFIGPPFGILVIGLVLWGVGKFFDAKQTLNAAMVVATFSYVPRVVEGVVARVQGLFVDPDSLDSRFSLSLGVGRFFDPDTASPVLLGLIGRIDVFTIWVTVLLAIGLAVTGKISRGRAAMAGAIVWLIGALPALASALRG
jgi:hypothetical protein